MGHRGSTGTPINTQVHTGKEQIIKEVREALSSKISESKEVLDGQEIGSALYGLQGIKKKQRCFFSVDKKLSKKAKKFYKYKKSIKK